MAARVWHQLGPLAGGVGLALVIRALLIETFYVPSESMLPTLLIGDHVFVNKFLYGARIPFTDIRLPALREPRRGDVVVFDLGRRNGSICPLDRCPGAPADSFIKRIVAVPGDTVEVRAGRAALGGARLPVESAGTTFRNDKGWDLQLLEEELDGCRHEILDLPGHDGLPQGRIEIPPDHYFVLGDNRDESNDSRGWGLVPRGDVRGPAFLIYWSWNNRSSWLGMLNPWTWVRLLWGETRWSRTGRSLGCWDE